MNSRQKVIVITGAASGIGKLLALKFDASGDIVFALDIDELGLGRLREESGGRVHGVLCDLSSKTSISEAFRKVLSRCDHIDVLVNNAGIVHGIFFQDQSQAQIEQTFAINAISHFYTIQEVLPSMTKRNQGHIVTVASAGGFIGAPQLSAYSSSKFAAVGTLESLRGELRAAGVNIKTTLVAPFFIRTGMFDGVRTRFPFLLPILKPEYVAERIFKAIVRKRARVIMPWFVYTVFPMRLLPPAWFDVIADFFGINSVMTHFTGRKKD